MEPSESFEEATKCAQSATKKMAKLGIFPYPRNFTIWYSHFTGKYPDLSEVLEKFLKKDGYFNEDRNTLLYQKFFGFDQLGRTIREVTSGTTKILGDAFRHVKKLCNDSKSARDELEACCSKLEKAGSSGEMNELVQQILSRVRSLEKTTFAMEERLNEDFKKISALHMSLEESQRESMTDALTGIANRKLFDSCLRLAAEDPRKAVSLSVILFDIDRLGEFNEAHGHKAGDDMLKALAVALNESVKGRDLPVRYSDDEFAVLATRTQLPDAVKLARTIRGAVGVRSRAMDVEGAGTTEHRTTISIGVAQYEPGESLNRFMERVKRAMAAAKANGRNQVVAAEKTSQGIMLWDEDHLIINPLGGKL